MSNNKKMIILYGIMLIVTFVLSLLLNINEEFEFVEVALNSFWYTIFSGVVAGLVVSLASEIRQYNINKRNAENGLFYIAINLYSQISMLDTSISYYLQNETSKIYIDNITGTQIETPLTNLLQQLKYIDYAPFCKRNKIKIALDNLNNHWLTYNHDVIDISRIRITYNEILIKNLELYKCEGIITCQNDSMKIAMKTVSDNMGKIKNDMLKFCKNYPEKKQKEYDLVDLVVQTEKSCKQILRNYKI